MAKSLKELLAEPDDFELCNRMVLRIVERHGDPIDASAVSEVERVVLLVWHVSGIIGNGGFRYLFEGNLEGDPYFALTAEAFQAAGCQKAAEAVRATLALFPNSRPPTDVEERLRYYLKRIKAWPTDMDMQFFAARDDLAKSLASYIRSRADAFTHLDSHNAQQPPKRHPRAERIAPKRKKLRPPLDDLPRWARVAIAARCARQVFSLLAQHWPAVPLERSNAVRLAIDLAEQSAAEGRAVAGLDNAVLQALVSAGAALVTGSQFVPNEAPPENTYSGTIASLVAKIAEKAAESAGADVDRSLLAATQAWSFATDAATSAEAQSIVDGLKEDFRKLHRAASRGKWTDRTKIPSEIWSMLD